MSRTGFSIRKLIDQRRRWSDSDDDNDEEAFECSSAKTIRMQYELEQYQIQQLQQEGHPQLRHRSSWMSMSNNNNNNNSTPKKSQRKTPTPITVVRHASVGVMPQSGSASRRISTPLPASGRSLTGRLSPATPHSQTSHGSVRPGCGEDRVQQAQHGHRQQINVPRRAASCLNLTQASPQHPKSIPSDLLSPGQIPSPSLARKMSYEKSSPVHDTTMYLSSPGLRNGVYVANPPQHQTPTTTHHRKAHIKTASLSTPTDTAANFISRSSSSMSSRNRQQAAFVNGQPSPPLEPEDEHRGDLRTITPEPEFTIDSESTWFLGEGEEEEQPAVPDNVQQLISKTDDAFRAVSSALADARQAPHSQHLQQLPQALQTNTIGADMLSLQTRSDVPNQDPTPSTPSQLVSPMSPTAGAGRGTVASARKGSKSSSLSSSPQIRRSPTQSSITKSKRGSKSPVAKRSAFHDSAPSRSIATGSPSKGHRSQHSYQRSLTRLNLAADKVTDKLFEGRTGRFGFHKIEADEVITPSQVQLFRQTRLAKAEAEAQARAKKMASNETLHSAAGSVGDGNSSDVGTSENTPDEPSDTKVNVLRPVVKMSSPEPLSGLNKDVACPNPFIAEAKTPTDTKEFDIGQNPLATPPATPPQLPTTFSSQAPTTDEDESMRLKNIGFHTASSRRATHTRGNSSLSNIPPLPTIPEVRITAPRVNDNTREFLQQGRNTPEIDGEDPATPTKVNEKLCFDEDDEHMFLASTSLTATMPSFQHGRIRLAKADLVNTGTINSLESKLLTSPDETLDWTAFQMAILGGAGDLFSDPDNFLSRDAQEEMVDDLCDWFEDLGFSNQSLGALATKEADSSTSTNPTTPLLHMQATVTSTPDSANRAFYDPSRTEQENSPSLCRDSATSDGLPDDVQEMVQFQSMPIPISSEHPSGFWNTRPFDASRFFTGSGCVIKRWTLEGHPKRYQGPGIDVNKANVLPRSNSDLGGSPKRGRRESVVRASVDSLPQSPMLDLRMTTAVDGSKEFVPMGYNLGHDLGDFLKWESEHVYASGFYGAD